MDKQILRLSTLIDAPKEKIWQVLLNDSTYREWTSVFHEGSYFETDWKEGSKALFKTPEGNGMVSLIKHHLPGELLTIEHRGVLKNNIEYFDEEHAQKWHGLETYRLSPVDQQMELAIEQDIPLEYASWFTTTWEKALQKIKELSENES